MRTYLSSVMFIGLLSSLGLVACGGSVPIEACPDSGTDLTYDNFADGFFNSYCRSCHATGSGIAEAQDLPFDTFEDIKAHADEIAAEAAGDNTSMPPGGGPTQDERDQLAEWIACGTP